MRIALGYLIVALFVVSAGPAHAQDLVVRSDGDSVNCHIRGSDRAGIHFDHLVNGKLEHVYLRHGDVRYVHKGFYEEHFQGSATIRELRGFPYFRVAVQGGIGWLTGVVNENDPQWLQVHNEGLRYGQFLGGDVHYMATNRWSVGMQATMTRFGAVTENATFYLVDGSTRKGRLVDDVQIAFIGPSVAYYRSSVKHRLVWTMAGSVGSVFYRDKAVFLEPVELYGWSFGARVSSTLEHRTKSGLAFGVIAARTLAGLTSMKLRGDPIGYELLGTTGIDLSRWDFGLCLSYTY